MRTLRDLVGHDMLLHTLRLMRAQMPLIPHPLEPRPAAPEREAWTPHPRGNPDRRRPPYRR